MSEAKYDPGTIEVEDSGVESRGTHGTPWAGDITACASDAIAPNVVDTDESEAQYIVAPKKNVYSDTLVTYVGV